VNCRHCHADLSINVLDLGSTPPSNAYLSREDVDAPQVSLPLRLRVCEVCWLVQTQGDVAPDELFTKNYAYFSSLSSSWLAHSEQYVHDVITTFSISPESLVCEIAANDGYLLQYFQKRGIPCFGIEPTLSTATAARTKGLDIIEAFFDVALSERLVTEGRTVDLAIANNVLAHVPDINGFIAAFARLLKPSGVVTFEFPHVLRMIEECQFDTAYHEHYSYLSLTAISRIFPLNGLSVFNVTKLSTHGGSLRVIAQRLDTGTRLVEPAVQVVLEEEQRAGITNVALYSKFQRCAEAIKDDLLTFLIDVKRSGKTIGAYGAAAKGNTLLNFAGVRPDLLPYVVDRSPAKQGRFLPASQIPIVSEQHFAKDRPDYVLILPWNLRPEIVEQLEYARSWGAKFVTVIPRLLVS
jgi:SAM-dependent methyltransferase